MTWISPLAPLTLPQRPKDEVFMKPDTNQARITPAQHLHLIQSMRLHCDYLEQCGIPPAVRFHIAMIMGREHYCEIKPH